MPHIELSGLHYTPILFPFMSSQSHMVLSTFFVLGLSSSSAPSSSTSRSRNQKNTMSNYIQLGEVNENILHAGMICDYSSMHVSLCITTSLPVQSGDARGCVHAQNHNVDSFFLLALAQVRREPAVLYEYCSTLFCWSLAILASSALILGKTQSQSVCVLRVQRDLGWSPTLFEGVCLSFKRADRVTHLLPGMNALLLESD